MQKLTSPKKSMQTLFFMVCMFLCLGLNACQCSDKPEVGPVQESGLTAANPSI